EDDGVGVERRAVLERDTLAELEGQRLSVRRDGPSLGQFGGKLDAVALIGDQGFEDALDDLGVLAPLDLRGIQGGRIGAPGPDERVPVGGLAAGREEENKKDAAEQLDH